MTPWYRVVTPRKEVREGRSFNPDEFAIALEQVVAKTAPVAMTSFMTEREVLWGQISAGGTLVMIPVIVFTMLVQKHIVRGLTLGAVK